MNRVNATYKLGASLYAVESPHSFSVSSHINDFPSKLLKSSHAGINLAQEKWLADISEQDQYGEYGSMVDLWASMYQSGMLGTDSEKIFADLSEGYWFVKGNRSIYDLDGRCLTNPWVGHSYHYDAELFSTVIGELVGQPAGVVVIDSTVTNVNVDANGNIENVCLANGQTVTADCFVDCSGFKRLLIKHLDNAWQASDEYYNDTAMVAPIFYDDHSNPTHSINTTTNVGSMNAGWRFSIPLQHRSGNGYIFNSRQHHDPDQLAAELDKVVDNPRPGQYRTIKWQPGRYSNALHKNCLALGLSAGFTDPFDANNLAVTCEIIAEFVSQLKQHSDSDSWLDTIRTRINRKSHDLWQDVDMRIQSWTRLSPRRDTEHYRLMADVAAKTHLRERFIDTVQDMRRRTGSNLDRFYMRSWSYVAVALRYGIDLPKTKLDNDIMALAKNYFDFNSRKWRVLAQSAPTAQQYYQKIKQEALAESA